MPKVSEIILQDPVNRLRAAMEELTKAFNAYDPATAPVDWAFAVEKAILTMRRRGEEFEITLHSRRRESDTKTIRGLYRGIEIGMDAAVAAARKKGAQAVTHHSRIVLKQLQAQIPGLRIFAVKMIQANRALAEAGNRKISSKTAGAPTAAFRKALEVLEAKLGTLDL